MPAPVCLFVEQLTVIDCALLDAARGLVGESWIVDLELEGELDDQSMVLDFGVVKRRIKQAIDASVDHTLLLPTRAAELEWQEHSGDGETRLRFTSALGVIEHRAPRCAVSLIDAAGVDSDAVRAHLEPLLAPLLPASVTGLRLHLRHERIDGAYYHYTHGLKKHRGECQRIAHGHRSRIEVRAGGRRLTEVETAIAVDWADIYLGSREDLVDHTDGRMTFAYTAPEGHFELTLPEQRVRLLDSDSTVECIAGHLARRVATDTAAAPRGGDIEVRAYEGVQKGAIARAAAAVVA